MLFAKTSRNKRNNLKKSGRRRIYKTLSKRKISALSEDLYWHKVWYVKVTVSLSVCVRYNCEDGQCYSDLARLRGLYYITWENKGKLIQEDEVGIWGVGQNPGLQDENTLGQNPLLEDKTPRRKPPWTKPPRKKTI